MKTPSQDEHGPNSSLDDGDVALLADIRAAYTDLDPVPDGLVDRVQFAMALEDIDVEVLHLREVLNEPASVRSEELCRTITFDSVGLTIMVMLTPAGERRMRIDGWLAPPAAHEIEVRTAAGPVVLHADGEGRFVAESVARGLCQLVVRLSVGGRNQVVATPSIVL